MNEIMKYINKVDYTILDLNASDTLIKSVCENAIKYKVKSVCVYPQHAMMVKKYLKNTDVLLCCVYNFPNGDHLKDVIINDITKISNAEADEVDMVLDYKFLKQNWETFNDDVDEVLTTQINNVKGWIKRYNKENTVLKVIVESGELIPEQIEYVTKLCINLDVDFIKTSTGKTEIGVRLEDVIQMRRIIDEIGSPLKIKASGGIRTLKQIKDLNPLVDRFGIGYGTVDKLYNEEQ